MTVKRKIIDKQYRISLSVNQGCIFFSVRARVPEKTKSLNLVYTPFGGVPDGRVDVATVLVLGVGEPPTR